MLSADSVLAFAFYGANKSAFAKQPCGKQKCGLAYKIAVGDDKIRTRSDIDKQMCCGKM